MSILPQRRICITCKKKKPLSDFYKDKKDKRCIKCERERCLKYYYKKKAGYIFIPRTLEERFFEKICKGKTPNDCWEWTAALQQGGYGKIGNKGRFLKAHRVSYKIHFGEIPEGILVLHKCDNPPCCNPKHLWLGTHRDNSIDMAKKGRNKTGEEHPHHKLTDLEVLRIRKKYKTGEYTHRDLGIEFNISQGHISDLVNFKKRKILSAIK